MSVEVYEFAVTIPAGTAKSAGFTAAMAMPTRTVDQIDVRVPPGPRGEVGFGIGASQTIVIPQGNTAYFVMDDQFRPFVLDNAITSGAWVFFGYNTGQFPHTIYVTFHVSLPYATAATSGTGTPIPSGSLDSGGTSAGSGTSGTSPVEVPPPVTVPPVTVPPVTTPVLSAPPLVLPPASVPIPGAPAASIPPTMDELLVGAGTSGTVWLLDERGYSQVTSQDDLNALTAAGVASVQLSDAGHAALVAAAGQLVSVSLGSETLSGILSLTYSGVTRSLLRGT